MHEHGFSESIVKSILEELKKFPSGVPTAVGVKVGEVFHLTPQSVRLHFEHLTRGTPLEAVRLELDEVPIRVRCRFCGNEGTVEDHHLPACGVCAATGVEILEGNKFYVDWIEFKDDVF